MAKISVVMYLLGILFVDKRYATILMRRIAIHLIACCCYLVVIVKSDFNVRELVWIGAVFVDNVLWVFLLAYERIKKLQMPYMNNQSVMMNHMITMTRYLVTIGVFNLFQVRMGVEDFPYSTGYTIMSFITGAFCVLIMIGLEMIYSSSLSSDLETRDDDELVKHIYQLVNCMIQAIIVIVGGCLSNMMLKVNQVFDQFNDFVDLPPYGFTYIPNVIVSTSYNSNNTLMASFPAPSRISSVLLPSYPQALSQITVVTDSSSSLTVSLNPELRSIFTSCIIVYYVICTLLAISNTRWEWKKWIFIRVLYMVLLAITGYINIHPAFSFFAQGSLFAVIVLTEYHRRIYIENLYEE
jgi:hypothetical protein